MNCYATLDDLKAVLGITATTRDAELVRALESASRELEGPSYCNRVFYTRVEARYFDPPVYPCKDLFLDDVISVSEVALDTEEDGGFATLLIEDTDFALRPYNAWPKEILEKLANSVETWPVIPRSVRITGTWGYGDETGSPWRAAFMTLSISATATSVVIASEALQAGQTILVDAEQIFVESVVTGESVTTAGLRRGMNGTAAAAHGLFEGTIGLEDVEADTTVTINGLVFTAHADTTTASSREFSIIGDDTADAAELAGLINDETYGVAGVTAVAAAGVITLTVDEVDPVTIVAEGSEETVTVVLVGADVNVAQYPADVVAACKWFAVESWKSIQSAGFLQERIGDYFYTTAPSVSEKQKRNLTWRTRRHSV